MPYRVEIAAEALAEVEQAYLWIHRQSPRAAAVWLKGVIEQLNSLETYPRRCPLAPENDAFEEEIRQILYGRRGGVYRILFTIAGETVRILHVRHAARSLLMP